MKILVLSDIHGSNTGLMTTLELCQRHQPDLVVICGDITQFGPHEWAEKYLKRIPIQAAALPGNCDPIDLDRTIEESGAINLHRRSEMISGIPFIGAGGADYTPFNTIFEFGDDTFADWLNPILRENAVLVTHAPAYGILDTIHSGKHKGSRGLRTIVDRWKPILMLSGHLHDARGVIEHKGTVFVNPGPAKDGYGALVELTTPEELGYTGEIDPGEDTWKQVKVSVKAQLLQA